MAPARPVVKSRSARAARGPQGSGGRRHRRRDEGGGARGRGSALIGLDTNVVVRFLVEDDEEQSARAAALIDRAVDDQESLFLTQLVVCAVAWVLETSYRFSRGEIAAVLRDLLRARQTQVEDVDAVHRALDAFAEGKGDLADYLILERARLAGCDHFATFDRDLLGETDAFAP